MYQFIKYFLDNKMSIFEEYGAFKGLSKFVADDSLFFFLLLLRFPAEDSHEIASLIVCEK